MGHSHRPLFRGDVYSKRCYSCRTTKHLQPIITMKPACLLFLSLAALRLAAADFDVRDEAQFKKIIPADAKVEKLADGFGFTEGPLWIPADGGYLVFSDIPKNQLKKWTRAGGISTFREPSRNINGNTLDREGRLTSAEHSGRQVSVTEKDGTVKTLVDAFDGKKFNSPNDVVVKSDGTVWFTDPPYGLPRGEKKEQDGNYVYRFDPATKKTTVVAKDFDTSSLRRWATCSRSRHRKNST